MISNVSALSTGGTGSSSTKGLSGSAATSKDDFLKMLLVQLKHQDPLQPPDASKFADQMTQFGQLEQLFNVNSTLENVMNMQISNNLLQPVSMIGKKVDALGDQVRVGDGPAFVGFHLDQPAADVTVNLKNGSGQVVRTLHYSAQGAGPHSYEFDGKDAQGADLPAGNYVAEMSASDANGKDMPVTSLISGTVTSVEFGAGGVRLFVGDRPLTMDQITSVRG